MVHARAETHEVQRLLGRHRVGGDFGDERDILTRSQARDEIVELKYKPDRVAPVAGERGFVGAAQIPTAIEQGAAGGCVEAAKKIQQGGLAAAGGPEHHQEFARVTIERDSVERTNFGLTGTVDFSQRAGVENRCGRIGVFDLGHS